LAREIANYLSSVMYELNADPSELRSVIIELHSVIIELHLVTRE